MVPAKDAYVGALVSELHKHANAEQAIQMKRYMKEQFDFLGIRAPLLAQRIKQFVRDHGRPAEEDIVSVTQHLWELPQREYQYAGIAFLKHVLPESSEACVRLFEHVITSKPWWDTVDDIAKNLVGVYFLSHKIAEKDFIDERVEQWLSSHNIWLQRTVVLHQLGYKDKTDETLLFSSIERVLQSKEFFIRKAIGWALREYAKVRPERVVAFVEATPALSGLSRREALKHVNTHDGHIHQEEIVVD